MTGIILAGFGFGSFVFSFVAIAIVNPDNEAPYELPNGNLVYSEEIALRVSPRTHQIIPSNNSVFPLGSKINDSPRNIVFCPGSNCSHSSQKQPKLHTTRIS